MTLLGVFVMTSEMYSDPQMYAAVPGLPYCLGGGVRKVNMLLQRNDQNKLVVHTRGNVVIIYCMAIPKTCY